MKSHYNKNIVILYQLTILCPPPPAPNCCDFICLNFMLIYLATINVLPVT